jgi:hypothetical protein
MAIEAVPHEALADAIFLAGLALQPVLFVGWIVAVVWNVRRRGLYGLWLLLAAPIAIFGSYTVGLLIAMGLTGRAI